MTLEDDELPKLTPAELEPRFLAGVVDLLVVSLLMGATAFVQMVLSRGVGLPMWGVFAAVVCYQVIPLALFRRTLGMSAFGLEMVSRKTGSNPSANDLLFRELIGRGFFPFTFLAWLFFSFILMALGLGTFAMPQGAGLILFFISIILLTLAVVGMLLATTRPDRCSFADIFARTMIVPRQPPKVLTDEDEKLDAARAGRGRRVRFMIAEVLVMALGIGTPFLLTRSVGETTEMYAERLKRERLEALFELSPADVNVARELLDAYNRLGWPEKAQEVQAKHQRALVDKEQAREAQLRAQIAASPTQEAAISALMELLESENRKADVRDVWLAWRKAAPQDDGIASGYGVWLSRNGYDEEAVAELTQVLERNSGYAEGFAYRGLAYKRLDQNEKARDDLKKAMELDPDYELEDELAEVEAKLR